MTNTLPVAPFEPAPLEGEPATDKAFVSEGVTYRVRVVVADIAALVVATLGDAIAPYRRDFDITVTELDADGLTLRDGAGNVIIVAQTRWSDPRTSDNPMSPGDTLDMMIGNLIHNAKGVAQATIAMDEVLASWGGGIAAAPPVIAPVSQQSIDDLPEDMRPNMTDQVADVGATEGPDAS